MRYGPRSPIHPLRSYWPRPSRKSLRAFSYPALCNKTGPYYPPTSTTTTVLLLVYYFYYIIILLLPYYHQGAGTVAQDVPNGLGMGGLSLLVDDNGGNVNNPQLNGPQNILVGYQFQYQSNWVAVMLCHLEICHFLNIAFWCSRSLEFKLALFSVVLFCFEHLLI